MRREFLADGAEAYAIPRVQTRAGDRPRAQKIH